MIILVAILAEERKIVEFEANSCEGAMDELAKTYLVSEYDKMFGNLCAIKKPQNKNDLKKKINDLIISTGEYYEYFGYPSHGSVMLLEYLKGIENEF